MAKVKTRKGKLNLRGTVREVLKEMDSEIITTSDVAEKLKEIGADKLRYSDKRDYYEYGDVGSALTSIAQADDTVEKSPLPNRYYLRGGRSE